MSSTLFSYGIFVLDMNVSFGVKSQKTESNAFNYYCSLLQVWKDTEMYVLIWGLKCLLGMLRCMLGSVKGVKSENPKGEGEFRKWEGGDLNN